MSGSLLGLGALPPGLDPRFRSPIRGETPRQVVVLDASRSAGASRAPRLRPQARPRQPLGWNPWADLRARQQRLESEGAYRESLREGTLGGTADDAAICAQGLGQTADPLATILGSAITAGGMIGGQFLQADAAKAAADEQADTQRAMMAANAQAALDQANLALEARGQDEALAAQRAAGTASVVKTAVVAVAGLAALGIGLKLVFGRKKA